MRCVAADVFHSVSEDDGDDESDDAEASFVDVRSSTAFVAPEHDDFSVLSFRVTRTVGLRHGALAAAADESTAGNAHFVDSFVNLDDRVVHAVFPPSPLRDKLLTPKPPPVFAPSTSLAEVTPARGPSTHFCNNCAS